MVRAGPIIGTDDTTVTLVTPKDLPPPDPLDPKSTRVREVIAVIANAADAAPSIRLHEKAGFVRVGEMDRVGRKFDEWIGVVMMQKSLADD